MLKRVCRALQFLFVTGITVVACGVASPYSNPVCAGVVILQNSVSVSAGNSIVTVSDEYTDVSIPASHLLSVTAETDGRKQELLSAADINYSQSAGGAAFTIDFSQQHQGAAGSLTLINSLMTFEVSTDVSYSLSGLYAVSHRSPPGGSSGFLAQLEEIDQDGTVQLLSYSSHGTGLDFPQSVQHQLSEGGVNDAGSLNGNLLAGRTYRFSWQAFTFIGDDDGAPAAARGNVTLVLGDGGVSAVPEPGSLAIFGFGTLFVAGMSRRRRITSAA